MKKLLLLLLLSLTYIGSTNANSIQGGFGYKLGQSVPSAEITYNASLPFVLENFTPINQMPPFDNGYFYTTLNEKKIYKLVVYHIEDSSPSNSCNYWSDYVITQKYKILTALRTKYSGMKFKEYYRYPDREKQEWFYSDGDRSIKLTCKWEYQKKTLFKPRYGEYKLELEYFDSYLSDLYSDEAYAYKQKKAREESSDYDF